MCVWVGIPMAQAPAEAPRTSHSCEFHLWLMPFLLNRHRRPPQHLGLAWANRKITLLSCALEFALVVDALDIIAMLAVVLAVSMGMKRIPTSGRKVNSARVQLWELRPVAEVQWPLPAPWCLAYRIGNSAARKQMNEQHVRLVLVVILIVLVVVLLRTLPMCRRRCPHIDAEGCFSPPRGFPGPLRVLGLSTPGVFPSQPRDPSPPDTYRTFNDRSSDSGS